MLSDSYLVALDPRLSRLKRQQAAEWEEEDAHGAVAAQGQALREEERKRAREERRRAKGRVSWLALERGGSRSFRPEWHA